MRINIYGGPGSGKSTLAAWLFSQLKERQVCIELITEYVKSWAWRQVEPKSWDELYIFAKQLKAEDEIMRHGYVHLITDSPLPLTLTYIKKEQAPFYLQCKEVCELFEESFPSIDIFIERTKPYQQEGRYQTEEEAKELDSLIFTTVQEVIPALKDIHVFNEKLMSKEDLLKNVILPVL